MAFSIARFVATRPYVFHLTAQGNLNGILATRTLLPAATLQSVNGRQLPRLTPRGQHLRVDWNGYAVWIRDQLPLNAKNIEFGNGWDLSRLLTHIDEHVFFWPGTERGPVDAGRNHFERYVHEQPALLRVGTADLIAANRDGEPLFCRFNSGAPRCSGGRKSPRGDSTYLPAAVIERTPGAVKEVVFHGAVQLPHRIDAATDYSGPWTPLR